MPGRTAGTRIWKVRELFVSHEANISCLLVLKCPQLTALYLHEGFIYRTDNSRGSKISIKSVKKGIYIYQIHCTANDDFLCLKLSVDVRTLVTACLSADQLCLS